MAKTTIKAQMKQRRDTKANWASSNPVLLSGELGFVSDDPNLYKMGDGVTPWNLLPFRGFDGTLAQELGTSPNAVISQKVLSEKFAEIDGKIENLEENSGSGSGSTGGTDLSNGGTINGSLKVTGNIDVEGTLGVEKNLYFKGADAYHRIYAADDGNLAINSVKVLEVTTKGGMTIDGNVAIHAGNIGNYVSSGGTGGTIDTFNLVNINGAQTITGPKTFEAIRIHGDAQLSTDLKVTGTPNIGSGDFPLGSISTKGVTVKQVLSMGDGSYVLGNLVPNANVKNTLGSAETPWDTLYAKNVVIGRDGLEGTAATIWSKINLYNDVTVRGHLKVVDQDVITQKVITQESNTITLAEEGGIYIINTLNAGDVTISAFEAPYTDIGRYTFIFRGASSLTLPSNVLWANGTVPTIEAEKYYELSVMATKIAGTTYYKAILAGFKAA